MLTGREGVLQYFVKSCGNVRMLQMCRGSQVSYLGQNPRQQFQVALLGSGYGGEGSCGFQRQKSQKSGKTQRKKKWMVHLKTYFKINTLVEKSRWQNHKMFIQTYLLIDSFSILSCLALCFCVLPSVLPMSLYEHMHIHAWKLCRRSWISEDIFHASCTFSWVFHCTHLKKKQSLLCTVQLFPSVNFTFGIRLLTNLRIYYLGQFIEQCPLWLFLKTSITGASLESHIAFSCSVSLVSFHLDELLSLFITRPFLKNIFTVSFLYPISPGNFLVELINIFSL